MAFALYQLWPQDSPFGFPFSSQRVPQFEIEPSSGRYAPRSRDTAGRLSPHRA